MDISDFPYGEPADEAVAERERLVDQFEDAWQAGRRPAIEDYLPVDGVPRQVVLLELVHADLEYRLKAGEPARVEEYWQRYPELAHDRAAALDLIAAEYDLRRGREPGPSRAEYLARFPEYGPVLLARWEARPASADTPGGSGQEVAAPAVLPGGSRLGKYELLGVVGSGAFGVVYRARDTELQRTVAVKVPRPDFLAGRGGAARFLREARSAARLQHPHIVALHDVHQAEGTCYLVYEFVEGRTLAEALRAGGVGARRAAELLAGVAEALAYAHSRGVIHRDLKPSNVLLDGAGRPHVTDLGLAKWETAESLLTQEGEVLGTPAYMSPEQARGEAHSVDARSDVYSLGVILYECLTGEVPFRGSSRMVLRQVLEEDPRPPRRLNDKVPRDLETVCLKCLRKEPAKRYASAGELAEDLRRFLAGEPVRARPVGAWERGWTWARRRPAVAALLLVSGVAVLALGGVVTGSFYHARTREALEAEARARQRAEQFQYLHHVSLAHVAWREGNVRRAEQLLEDCPADQRGWEWHYLRRLCHPELLTLRGHTGWVWGVAFSRDGTRLASAGQDGVVKVWEAATGRELLALKGDAEAACGVAFSPDGQRLAWAGGDGTVNVSEMIAGREIVRLRGHRKVVRSVLFNPEGTRLASASLDGTVKLWDARTGQEVFTFRGHTGDVCGVAFSPGGKRVASASQDGTVKVWEAATGRELLTPKRDPDWVWGVAFSPDGQRLAFSSGKAVRTWDLATGQEVRTLKGHTSDVNILAFSPDGALLASASDDGTVKVWDARGGPEALLTLKGHTAAVWGVAFSPDGARLASASRDGTVKLWDTTAGGEARTLKARPGGVRDRGTSLPAPQVEQDSRPPYARAFKGLWAVAVSPDSKRIASAGNDGAVRVWDVVTGREARAFTAHTGAVFSVAFSPDGTRLASAGSDGTIRLWEAETGRKIRDLRGQAGRICCVAFSPGGTRLASAGSDGTIQVWEVATGREVLALKGDAIWYWSYEVAFSPDGTRLASSSDGRVWDLTTGRQALALLALRGQARVLRGVAFSPDGTRLASTSQDQTVKLWDATTGEEIRTFTGHLGNVQSVAFSPDGTRLASCGDDRTVRVWDTATGQETLVLTGHTDHVRRVAFSPDGAWLISASMDGTAKVWDARPLTPETGVEREALGLLDFLFARPLRRDDVRAYLRRSEAIRPEVREKALALAERYREETDPERYHRAAWALVRQPHLNPFQYRFALRQAETACRLAPGRAPYRTTLGAARYRAGNLPEALTTLRHAQAVRPNAPAGLAFLAMAQHRAGQTERARKTLARLKDAPKGPPGGNHEETRALLREAEALIGSDTPGRGR